MSLLDTHPRLTIVRFGVGEGVLRPVHVGGAVADRLGEHIERTEAGHVRVSGVGLPQIAHRVVAPRGPQVIAVDVHPYSHAAQPGDQLLAAG